MPYITVYDCAEAAKAIYKNTDFPGYQMLGGFFDPKNTPRFGWAKADDAGGASAATYKFQDHDAMYILSFRGSAGKPWKDGKDWTDDDASIAAGHTPDRASDALKYANQVKTQYPKAFIIAVGHSLGGYLAQLVGVQCDMAFMTFNAPPALGTWTGTFPNGTSPRNFRKGVNFRVNWDPVSRAPGSHVGPLITLPHQGMNITNAHGGAAVLKSVAASPYKDLPAMATITAANR